MWLLQLAITSLFTTITAVDGTSRDNRPSGDGKATCGDNEDTLKYLINSAEPWHEHLARHFN